jgi:hypothetical protein
VIAMLETVRPAHLVVKVLLILQDGMLESVVEVEDVLLDLVRPKLPANVAAMPQENSQKIQRQTFAGDLAHCRERVIVVRVWHLRGFQLPGCSIRAKGYALSWYIEYSYEEHERP